MASLLFIPMNPRLQIAATTVIVALAVATVIYCRSLPSEDAKASSVPGTNHSKAVAVNKIAISKDTPPAPAKRWRDPIAPKAIPLSDIKNLPLIVSPGSRAEAAQKRAQLRVDRELQSLKQWVPSLRADQEQRVREALEKDMPQIKEMGNALVTTLNGREPSLENPSMKELYDNVLDPDQKQSMDALLDGRKRTHDEAEATRGYTRALESLPDLTEDQKNALHDYYLGQAGQPTPTREQQQQALASFLTPDDIEILGDTNQQSSIPGFNLGSISGKSLGGTLNLDPSSIPGMTIKSGVREK